MRNKNRIPIVLSVIDFKKFIVFLKLFDKKEVDIVVNKINDDIKKLTRIWLKEPDLRLTQLLVNNGYIPNLPGLWYYTEEVDWLIRKKYLKFEDIHFWGSIFDSRGRKLSNIKHTLLKDLTDSHIKNILMYVGGIPIEYKKYFEKRLSKLR